MIHFLLSIVSRQSPQTSNEGLANARSNQPDDSSFMLPSASSSFTQSSPSPLTTSSLSSSTSSLFASPTSAISADELLADLRRQLEAERARVEQERTRAQRAVDEALSVSEMPEIHENVSPFFAHAFVVCFFSFASKSKT